MFGVTVILIIIKLKQKHLNNTCNKLTNFIILVCTQNDNLQTISYAFCGLVFKRLMTHSSDQLKEGHREGVTLHPLGNIRLSVRKSRNYD